MYEYMMLLSPIVGFIALMGALAYLFDKNE